MTRRQRLVMKLVGGPQRFVEYIDIDAPVTDAEFRAVAKKAAAELSGKRKAKRPGERKQTATRGGEDD